MRNDGKGGPSRLAISQRRVEGDCRHEHALGVRLLDRSQRGVDDALTVRAACPSAAALAIFER